MDILFNIPYMPNWETMAAQRQNDIIGNNNSENKRRMDYDYSVNDNVLIYKYDISPYLVKPTYG